MASASNSSPLPKPVAEAVFTRQSPDFDVTFEIEGKKLYAPKVLLRLASPVLERMLNSSFVESKNLEVRLPGKKYNDFLMFLSFLLPDSQLTVNEENVYSILPLSHEYQVAGLVKKCEIVLIQILKKADKDFSSWQKGLSDIQMGRALKATALADVYKLSNVLEKCVDVLRKADPTKLKDNVTYKSISDDTQYDVAFSGFEFCFQK